jgi:hypothetical protein
MTSTLSWSHWAYPGPMRFRDLIPSMLRVAFVTLGLLALAVTAASPAFATRKKAIWGPVEVNGVSQFPTYARLGVGIYESRLGWDTIARTRPAEPQNPADPAYRWPTEVDRAVSQASGYGMQVSLMVMSSPGWANGGLPGRWAPTRSADYADFLVAAARRYPAVHLWLIWGEPTNSQNFQPLTPDFGKPLRGKALRGPRRYARILDAAYGALKGVSRLNRVIGGNTFTTGTVSPKHWIQALRLPNGRPPRMDLYGHNPFSARIPKLSAAPLPHGYADFSDLDQLTKWLDRYMRRSRPDGHRLRLFLSEFSLPTGHANHEFNFYFSERTQARWLASALRIARRFARIYTFGYLGLYDDAPLPAGDQVERGLITRSGRRKPAFEAFRRG